MKSIGPRTAKPFLIVFCLFLSIACAQSPIDAKIFIANLFKGYGSSVETSYLGVGADTIFAQRLLSLIRLDQKEAGGEVGLLDSDPICGCQDPSISDVKITTMAVSPSEVQAVVHFKISETKLERKFILVAEKSKWRIEDIQSETIPSLVAFLEKGLPKQ